MKKLILFLEHPTYLANLALCNLFRFSVLKNYLKGSCFEPERYSRGYDGHSKQHRKQPWRSCVLAGRNYFEGDHRSSE
jgi:hypothetical protein